MRWSVWWPISSRGVSARPLWFGEPTKASFQITTASLYSPNTFRKVSEISPTVA